ncbi:ABC transporter permease [Pseudarthrobacter sp. J64]|uniref:ABC transporter permease n=1 Tax=Pseudarthrobacter sp. J64 TaxID=3116485 RepID=UPI002E81B970|nr:ABC transporter permease [Pseudarthrobacter sp. J64]MEE2569137.1 ABC transporter permease [Pseudarthrobacter sp. J64]
MIDVIGVEALKLRRSPVGVISTAAIVTGTLAILGGITAALASGDPAIVSKVGPVASTLDWDGLLAAAAQITSAGGFVGFGVVLSWMVGREFTDGTITGLFALPVSRSRIAAAKLAVYAVWSVAVSLMLCAGILLLGLALGYGLPGTDAWEALGRQWILGVLTAAAAVPVAWIATIARSILAAIGATIGLVVVAQVGALTGSGGWIPAAAPALWALSGGDAASAAQLGVTIAAAAAFGALTTWSWARLQLNR